jgi:hypothetical protein
MHLGKIGLAICAIAFYYTSNAQTGNVGIGTSMPNSKLHVKGSTQIDGKLYLNTSGISSASTNSNLAYGVVTSVAQTEDSSDINLLLYKDNSYSPWINFAKARGTAAAPTPVQENDELFEINGLAYHNGDFHELGGIKLFMDGTPTATSRATGMYFYTTPEGSLSHTPVLTIRKNSFVGIGTQDPQQQLSVMNGMNIDQENFNDGTITNSLRFGYDSNEGIASKRTAGGNQNGLDFYTNNSNRFSITNAGNVGIGSSTPTKAKLEILGNVNNAIGNFTYFQNGTPNTGTNTTGNSYNYSIYASNRIAASEFNAFSDARIKNIKDKTNNEEDLKTLSKIEITNYTLKDVIAKGSNEYKKVIAQQVERVYPQAVSKLTDVVPDIYKKATIQQGSIALANTLKVGDKVKLIFPSGEEIAAVKATTANSFIVDTKKEGEVFVYGREVNDFRSVDYEALSTLNISATQALAKQVEVLMADKKALATELRDLKEELKNIKEFLMKNNTATK